MQLNKNHLYLLLQKINVNQWIVSASIRDLIFILCLILWSMNEFLISASIQTAFGAILIIWLSSLFIRFGKLILLKFKISFGFSMFRAFYSIYGLLFIVSSIFLIINFRSTNHFFVLPFILGIFGGLIISLILFQLGGFIQETKVEMPHLNIVRSSGTDDHVKGTRNSLRHADFYLATFETGFNTVHRYLNANLIEPIDKKGHPFVIPGAKYPSTYLWDSCFILFGWLHIDPTLIFKVLKIFIQFQQENGNIPQTIAFGKFPNYKITNPPLIPWIILDAYKKCGDASHLIEFYEPMKKFCAFLESNRCKQGFFYWLHSYESGLDNSPRFTNQSESVHYDIQNLASVDFNSWMAIFYESMAEISAILNNSEDQKIFISKYESLKQLMNEKMWDESDGLYYDLDLSSQKLNKINTIASFFALTAGVPTKDRAQRLVEHINNEYEYNTLIPFPTVAKNHPEFIKDTWRGPVWINTSFSVIYGLKRYGYEKEAKHYSWKLVKGVYKTLENCGSLYEFYDPDRYDLKELSRKKGNLFKALTLGTKPVNKFCGWTGIVNYLFIEYVLEVYLSKSGLAEQIKPILDEEIKKELIENGKSIEIRLPYYKCRIILA